MSRVNLSQENLIEVINNYLEWNNLPIKWDAEGVCRGLAILHAQYALQNLESQFFVLLEQITNLMKNPYGASCDEIDHFIAQVALISKPQEFDKQYSQSDSHKLAKVNGKPLASNFNLAMVTTAENWVQIIKNEIKIQADELFLVSSGRHSITVQRKEGKYLVYNPNYPKGIKTIKNEKDLIEEMCSVFEQKKSNAHLGFRFQNLSLLDISITERPLIQDIYKRYGTKDSLSKKFSTFDKAFAPIFLIAGMNDSSFIHYLINNMKPSAQDLVFLRNHALVRSQNEIFKLVNNYIHNILDPIEREDDIRCRLLDAIEAGSLTIFEDLAQLDNGAVYRQFFSTPRTARILLKAAAAGGQPDIIRHIVSDIQNQGYSEKIITTSGSKIVHQKSLSKLIFQEGEDNDLLMQLINNDAHEGFVYLVSVTKHEGIELPLDNIFLYLERAIERNNYCLVNDVLDLLDKERGKILNKEQDKQLLINFSISTSQALKTNLMILNLLQERKVSFKPQILKVMKQKATHQVTFWEWLGIHLTSFVEFLKEQFGKQKHLEIYPRFLEVSKEMKTGEVSAQKNTVKPQVDPVLESTTEPLSGSKNHR